MKIKKILLGLILILVLIVPTTSLDANAVLKPAEPKGQFQITGAGATFPFPLIDKWRVEYNELYSGITLNYQSIGSGGGVKQHTEKTVDFGASDAPLTPAESGIAVGTLHIPESIGAVTISYNIPEYAKSGLKLTGDVIADIYMGKITKWNGKKIQDLNKDVVLPNKDILVVRRSDGSGTTFVFTDYLSTVSKTWDTNIGKGKSIGWPVGVGSPGNEGVAGVVRKTPYSIGYVELAYAVQSEMTFAFVQNADKTNFVEPSLESTKAAAAASVTKLPKSDGDWSKVSIVNQPGKNSYPISSFTYLLVYQDLGKIKGMDMEHAKALVHLIHWMITDGQEHAPSLLYVPLPDEVRELGKQGLAKIKFEGQQLFAYDGSGIVSTKPTSESTYNIPPWIKNNAKWWAENQISDGDFVMGIQYLVKEKIMIIPETKTGTATSSQQIPSWVKNNAAWWASGQIEDNDFVKGIQYLITQGIMKV
ncbi:MAG TPA: phosphate ABC transporter substrate-binding protein PstS [Nitrosopumilaceae archaeon]|nr:phosphate ABC transporter substrate-binding protein PstS [Nitrosopumilaceae archaeon]